MSNTHALFLEHAEMPEICSNNLNIPLLFLTFRDSRIRTPNSGLFQLPLFLQLSSLRIRRDDLRRRYIVPALSGHELPRLSIADTN